MIRSKPMPVSTCLAGSGVSERSGLRLYWMKTLFQISITRGSSPLTTVGPPVLSGRAVDVDLGARAARAGLAHLPEVVLAAVVDVVVGQAGDFLPEVGGLVVARDAVRRRRLRSTVTCRRVGSSFQTLVSSSHDHLDRLALEVVAEAPVAEHLEERVVPARRGRRRRGRCACRRRGCTSACWRRACTARFSVPRKIGLNWFIPALVNSSVGSSCGTTGELGTNVWPCFWQKKSMNCLADLLGRHHGGEGLFSQSAGAGKLLASGRFAGRPFAGRGGEAAILAARPTLAISASPEAGSLTAMPQRCRSVGRDRRRRGSCACPPPARTGRRRCKRTACFD